jgi:hypothetical protein
MHGALLDPHDRRAHPAPAGVAGQAQALLEDHADSRRLHVNDSNRQHWRQVYTAV